MYSLDACERVEVDLVVLGDMDQHALDLAELCDPVAVLLEEREQLIDRLGLGPEHLAVTLGLSTATSGAATWCSTRPAPTG